MILGIPDSALNLPCFQLIRADYDAESIGKSPIKEAYHSVPRAALGLSDHCLVHLILTYRQKLKSAKPVLRMVKRWTNEAEQDSKACFDLTD